MRLPTVSPSFARTAGGTRGVALVIVLAFVVLLSGLILAFFSRATGDRVISGGSSSQAKVELFAEGALDTVIGDLKQEMAAGSTKFAFPSGTPAETTLYMPTKPAAAVPARVGTDDALPNLVKRSASELPFYAGPQYSLTAYQAPARASTLSTTVPSLNGRAISAARWNTPYLLPKKNPESDLDPTPVSQFVPPDWVLVARDGSNPKTWNSALRDAAPTNNSFVVGRYAYTIYNEGGLLDMNVAGYPSGTTPTQSGFKPAAAFADLTQIGLTQNQIDQIVGWRNYASIQPAGAFPSFTFNTSQANAYSNFILSNSTGFLTTANQALQNGQTDRMFPSRLSLMRLLLPGLSANGSSSDRAHLQNALQNLGTFSRDIDQPSFFPNPGLPKIKSSTSSNNSTWGRGNDAYNTDRYESDATKKSPYDINPPLLAVRVTKEFTREDGTKAEVGEPLLKTRFPLSRLALILRTKTATKNDSDPIYRYFGLYRSSVTDPWSYDHGDSAGILRLSHPGSGGVAQGVAQRGREPDFFELLKAGIDVGSLAKTARTGNAGTIYQAQHSRDVLSALHILQIGANIIDQYDADGYSTRIVFGGSPDREVRGIEDLPYIYHLRNRPAFVSNNVGRWLIQPVLWNPHDQPAKAPTDAPDSFRIRAKPLDPAQKASFTVTYNHGETDKRELEWEAATQSYQPLTFHAGESLGYYGFRQPTLLAEENVPASSKASGNDFSQANVDPGMKLIGIVAADFLLKIPRSDNPAVNTYAGKVNFSGPTSGVEFITECQDGGDWTPFDSFVVAWEGSGIKIFSSGVNSDTSANSYINAQYKNLPAGKAIDWTANYGDTRWWGLTRTDPRTSRWSYMDFQYTHMPKAIDVANNIYETHRAGVGISFGNHHNTPDDKGFTGPRSDYNGPPSEYWYRGFQHGYWAENSVRETRQEAMENGKEKRRFNMDPDGIVRRAMAGYSTDSTQGGSFDNLYGLPFATPSVQERLNNRAPSRPMILNRPFKSVAELGYTFQGTAWKNLNFSVPESGEAALLDLFRLDEPARTENMVAGHVDLNTRQTGTLQALLAGTNVDVSDPGNVITPEAAKQLAQALVARTGDTTANSRKVPMTHRVDLVGTWNPAQGANQSTDRDPDLFFTGFSTDIGTIQAWKGKPQAFIARQRESAIRALSEAGTARTWNLLIDLVAQTGRYAPSASKLESFVVDGEKRYWLHIAIDRATGKVIDQKLEWVTE